MPRPGLSDLVTPPKQAERHFRSGIWTADTLASRVNQHADVAPNSLAVVDELGGRQRTYAELRSDAGALARALEDLGIGAGDVVSLQLPNCYEAVVSAVAVQSLGCVVNPLLPNYRAREIAHVFTVAQPRLIITPGRYRGWDYAAMIEQVRRQTGVRALQLINDATGPDGMLLPALIAGHQQSRDRLHEPAPGISELIFTSGTEAEPKAVMHGEPNANLAVRTLFDDLGIDEARTVWMPSPVGHSTGFNYGIRAALYHGLPLVLQDQWNAADALELIARFACSYTLAATTFLADLVAECERTGTQLSSLREFGCGGAPVPPDLVRRADARGIQVLRLYGSTEVLCASWNRPGDDLERRAHTEGLALSRTELQIRDDDDVAVAPGVVGELYIRGPQASVGFFADPERTGATYRRDGWIRSGDLATLDEDGYLTMVGRKKEIIIRGGVNIAPREIEELLLQFAEVDRAAVVGIPDDRLGERMCACLVLTAGSQIDLPTIVERLTRLGLAPYKLPQLLHLVDELPTTPSGKVQKHLIVEAIGHAAAASATERTKARTA